MHTISMWRCRASSGRLHVKRQLTKLKEKPEVIVATAGRLLELIQSHKLKLDGLQTLVVDEADEMLRMLGLVHSRNCGCGSGRCPTCFLFGDTESIFSEMHKWFGKTPKLVDVRAIDQTRGTVRHLFLQTDRAHQIDWLRTLAHTDGFKALVFFNQNASLERAAGILPPPSCSFCRIVSGRADRLAAKKR